MNYQQRQIRLLKLLQSFELKELVVDRDHLAQFITTTVQLYSVPLIQYLVHNTGTEIHEHSDA